YLLHEEVWNPSAPTRGPSWLDVPRNAILVGTLRDIALPAVLVVAFSVLVAFIFPSDPIQVWKVILWLGLGFAFTNTIIPHATFNEMEPFNTSLTSWRKNPTEPEESEQTLLGFLRDWANIHISPADQSYHFGWLSSCLNDFSRSTAIVYDPTNPEVYYLVGWS